MNSTRLDWARAEPVAHSQPTISSHGNKLMNCPFRILGFIDTLLDVSPPESEKPGRRAHVQIRIAGSLVAHVGVGALRCRGPLQRAITPPAHHYLAGHQDWLHTAPR